MLHSHLHNHHKFLLPNLPVSLTTHHFSSPSPLLLNFLHNKSTLINPNPPQASFSPPWLTKLTTATAELGDAINDSSSIQVTFSVLLTAAITVFFFPILQRRIKRAKQLVYYIIHSVFFSSCNLCLPFSLFISCSVLRGRN